MNAVNARDQACKASRSVNAYADGELEASRAVEVEQHLTACRSCGEELELIQAMRRSLRRSTVRTAPASLAERMRLVVEVEAQAEMDQRAPEAVAAIPPSGGNASLSGSAAKDKTFAESCSRFIRVR